MTLTGNRQQLARLAGFIAVALLSSTVGGCTAQPAPTPSSAATTHWKDGVEPAPNDLEDTPYVKYLRDIAWAEAIAWNTGDFSIPEYTDHGWENEATGAEIRYDRQQNEAYVYLAPQPFVPIGIAPVDRGAAAPDAPTYEAVSICVAPESAYKQMVDPDLTKELPTKPTVETHIMSVRPDGTISNMTGGSEDTCDDVNVPIALFDNPPTLPELPVTEPERTAPPATH